MARESIPNPRATSDPSNVRGQDVFVTKTGRADEPVIGWITNADLAKQVGV
jgi:hypothetical protein